MARPPNLEKHEELVGRRPAARRPPTTGRRPFSGFAGWVVALIIVVLIVLAGSYYWNIGTQPTQTAGAPPPTTQSGSTATPATNKNP